MLAMKTSARRTRTVSVYTRHSQKCLHRSKPLWKKCGCRKWLYIYEYGKDRNVSAKTRSWEEAERQAREISDSWDPIPVREKELAEREQKLNSTVPIDEALDRWLASMKQKSPATQYYAPWVRARQIQLEEKMIGAMQLMGASISL